MSNHKAYIGAGSLLSLTLLSGAILSAPKANADTSATVDLTVNVPAACSLTPANTNLVSTINPGTNGEIGTANIKAVCNDPNGFAIYAVGYTDEEYGNNYLTTTLGEDYKIATGNVASPSASQWNMTIGIDSTIANNHVATIENQFEEAHEVPETYTKIASLNSTTDQSIGANLTSTFNAYIAPNQAAGTYQGKVKFVLVHPSDTQAPDRFYGVSMQTVAQWGGEVAGGQTVTAIDERDGEEYTVTRLDDGNLWMTKNLRLNLKTANITVENTNNPTEYFTSALSIPPEPTDVWCNDNSAECINKISFDVSKIGDNTVDPSGHTYDEYGAYYNWFTATAGNGTYEMTSGNTTGDICPSGWHLPSGTEDGEYYRLKQLTAEQNGDLITGSAHFVYSGDARSYFGMTGFYWTSSADSGGGSSTNYVAKMAWINNGTLNPNSQYPKTGSFTVRCVADRRTMQNVSKWGNDVLQEQTVTAIDERDGQEYTVARLADGKLWMTKNLRLDLQTANITATNTNNPTAEFLSGVTNHPTPNNGDWCNNLAATCTDKIQFSTISINDPTVDSNGNSYDEYGVYYNYYTASAGNVSASVTSAAVTNGGGEAAGDICPKNWHLPKKTDYPTLDLAMGGSGQSPQWTTDAVQRWFASPSNYVTSGSMDYFGQYNRGNTGYYWTSTIYPRSGMNVYGTAIGSNYIDLGTYVLGTYFGYSIRCVTE